MNDFALDANILVRIANQLDPVRPKVLATLDRCSENGRFLLFPQMLTEFYVVATRPHEVNGLGLTVADLQAQIRDFLEWSELLPEPTNAFHTWTKLVAETNTLGKRAHDARLAASLATSGITKLITLNPRDFRRFDGVAGHRLELIVPG